MKNQTDIKRLLLAGCVIRDEKKRLLLIHRSTPKRTRWELPGGKVNLSEEPKDAAIRELQEELGITVKITRKLGETTFHEDAYEMNYMWFEAVLTQGVPTIQEAMFDEVKYISLKELQNHNMTLSSNLKMLLKALL